nr:MAG TPA: hypothetical protein [Bacteriophage sp.]
MSTACQYELIYCLSCNVINTDLDYSLLPN